MAEHVMLALGPFRFEVGQATYQTLAMNQSWRWPEQARLGREPALQFTGREPAEIRLQGVLFPGFDAGLAQVEEMRDLADRGEPLQLVDGLGRVWGAWVIVEVGDTRSVLMDNGQPRRVAFEVKLKAYGEDETVTDYSGSWSPFAIMPIINNQINNSSSTTIRPNYVVEINNLVNNSVSAITDLLDDIAKITPITSGSFNLIGEIEIRTALTSIIHTLSSAMRGLYSEWMLIFLADHPIRQALSASLTEIIASEEALRSGISLNTQMANIRTTIETLHATLSPLIDGRGLAPVAVYDMAYRTISVLNAAKQAIIALQEKLS